MHRRVSGLVEGLERLAGCPLPLFWACRPRARPPPSEQPLPVCLVTGKYHCPVLFAVFTNSTHIVAIRTTGNVYAYEVGSQGPCHMQAVWVCVMGVSCREPR